MTLGRWDNQIDDFLGAGNSAGRRRKARPSFSTAHFVATKLTRESVAKALDGFSLEIIKPFDDFCLMLQFATCGIAWPPKAGESYLFADGADDYETPFKQYPQPEAVNEGLADIARSIDGVLSTFADETNGVDRQLSLYGFAGSDDGTICNGRLASPDINKMKAALAGMEWLNGFVKQAKENPYTLSRDDRRIENYNFDRQVAFAVRWSGVFEWGFGQSPSFSQPDGPWPEFYQRLSGVALDVNAPPNMERILKAARREYRESQNDQ